VVSEIWSECGFPDFRPQGFSKSELSTQQSSPTQTEKTDFNHQKGLRQTELEQAKQTRNKVLDILEIYK
jgi:hypothetical protein